MKFRLKQFVDEATDWRFNDFKKARKKLVGIYMLIIFVVILLFSLLVILQAQKEPGSSPVLLGTQITVTEQGARQIFLEKLPNEEIKKTEYELENGILLFTMEYGDEQDLKVNLFNGEVLEPEKDLGVMANLINDFDEKVLWIGLLVFLIASFGSIFFANRTLLPIALSIRKEKEFVSGAAHELRNPLASMQAVLEASLLETNPVKKEFINDMLSETKRLIQTSESLLLIEKTQSRKQKKEEVSVLQIVEEVLKRLKPHLIEKKIEIKKNISAHDLFIDKSDLEIVIYNLLHNAIKFSNTGGIIEIVWSNKILSVSDTGIGMDIDKIPFVFDRFYKSDDSRNTSGSGLGLSIVKEILVRYKADIKVKSEQYKGTEFVVTF